MNTHKDIVWKVGVKMEYKYFIMEILDNLYLIREDVKEGPGHEAISALINKIESRSMRTIEQSKKFEQPKTSSVNSSFQGKLQISKSEYNDVYIYQFKK